MVGNCMESQRNAAVVYVVDLL